MNTRRRLLVLVLAQLSTLGIGLRRLLPIGRAFLIRSVTISGIIGDKAFAGQTGKLIITGGNLGDVYSVTFDHDGIAARVVAAHDTVLSIEVAISPEVPTGPVGFTIHKPSKATHSAAFNTFLAVESSSAHRPEYGYSRRGQLYSPYQIYSPYRNRRVYHHAAFYGVGGDLL